VWLIVMLVIIIYVMSIGCVMFLGSQEAGYPAYSDAAKNIQTLELANFNNFRFFGNIWRAMLTLFNIMLLSDETQTVLRAVVERQPWAAIVIITFILITGLGLLNTIIGVIVQRTVTVLLECERDKLNDKKSQLKAVETLAEIMFRLDVNGNDQLSLEELTQGAIDKDFTELLRQIELPHGFSVEELYDMLDTAGDYSLSRAEFIAGMFRLIYSTDFQRQCLFQVEVARLKRSVRGMQETMMKDIRHEHSELLVRIQGLISSSTTSKCHFHKRKQGGSYSGSSSGGGSSRGRSSSVCRSSCKDHREKGRSGPCGGDAPSSSRRGRDRYDHSVRHHKATESNFVGENGLDDNTVDTRQNE